MISTLLIALAVLLMFYRFYTFVNNKAYKKNYFNSALFYQLLLNMFIVMIGFSFIYYLLAKSTVILRISTPTGDPAPDTFFDLLYFSGVTLLAIGYGDYVPVGPAKVFAILEAAIGLLLPTAYFVKVISESGHEKNGK